jgi:hypothetical protein
MMAKEIYLLGAGIGVGLTISILYQRMWSSNTTTNNDTDAAKTRRNTDRPRSHAAIVIAAEREGYTLADVVAGHSISQLNKESTKNDPVALVSVEGDFLKPVQHDVRGDREIEFYKTTNTKTDIPVYKGLEMINGNKYIRLSNVEGSFKQPCTIDIKLGRQTWAPGATDAKKQRAKKKWKYMSTTATGVCGMKVYYPNQTNYLRLGKEYGRSLKGKSGMVHALTTFLFNGRVLRLDVINALIQQLKNRKSWLLNECQYVCYSMSILLVYEGDNSKSNCSSSSSSSSSNNNNGGIGGNSSVGISSGSNGIRNSDDNGGSNSKCVVVFVDFAHTFLKNINDDPIRHNNQSKDCIDGIDHVILSLLNIQQLYENQDEQ